MRWQVKRDTALGEIWLVMGGTWEGWDRGVRGRETVEIENGWSEEVWELGITALKRGAYESGPKSAVAAGALPANSI